MSLGQQEKVVRLFCAREDLDLVGTYIDPGASGRTDKRPEFQRMVADCLTVPRIFEKVVCVDFSRFFRDAHGFEDYRRQLERNGIELLSATQINGASAETSLSRGMINIFDGYSSEVNSAQTKRSMVGNAEAGYWNGSTPPFGYMTVDAVKLRDKQKKRLAIEPAESAIVRTIFEWCLVGDGGTPLGINRIVTRLNERGIKMRNKPFRTATVHLILHRETYAGTHYYNRTNSRNGTQRPRDEWIAMAVPSIVSPEAFASVQAHLASRRPQVTAPRTVTSPTLLAGLATCSCGSGMILMTGKSGQYRYLACERRRTQGKDSCTSKNVSMPLVDDTVLTALEEQILQPDRLRKLLSSVLDRSDEANEKRRADLKLARAEKTRIDAAMNNLLDAIEVGTMKPSDPLFAERIAGHRTRLEGVCNDIRLLDRQLSKPAHVITPQIINQFGELVRSRLRSGDHQLRQAYVRLLVERVTVAGSQVTITGSRAMLEQAVGGGLRGTQNPVPTFIRDWRARQESNLWPQD